MKQRMMSLFSKYREGILYLFFGGLAFLVSLATYALFTMVFGINELIANVISWIITVAFAFWTNRTWVFASKTSGTAEFFRQLFAFYGGRVATLLIEEGIIYVFITRMTLPGIPVKIAAQVVVIVLNYVISKLFIFKKDESGTDYEVKNET